MTLDLIYRFNYGPINTEEYLAVILFIHQQFYDYEAFKRANWLSSIQRRSWRSRLPFVRPSISHSLETNLDLRRRQWSFREKPSQEITLIDPLIGRLILSKLYPQRTERTRPTFRAGDVYSCLLLLETRLSIISWTEMEHRAHNTAPVPFAALFSEGIRTIDSLSIDGWFPDALERHTALSEFRKLCDVDNSLSVNVVAQGITSSKLYPSLKRLYKIRESFHFNARFPGDLVDAVSHLDLSPGIWLDSWKSRIEHLRTAVTHALGPTHVASSIGAYNLESANVDISNLDASYICSGPYRLMPTTQPERHLVLDPDGFLHIFWDFEEHVGNSLNMYKGHFLWDAESSTSM